MNLKVTKVIRVQRTPEKSIKIQAYMSKQDTAMALIYISIEMII